MNSHQRRALSREVRKQLEMQDQAAHHIPASRLSGSPDRHAPAHVLDKIIALLEYPLFNTLIGVFGLLGILFRPLLVLLDLLLLVSLHRSQILSIQRTFKSLVLSIVLFCLIFLGLLKGRSMLIRYTSIPTADEIASRIHNKTSTTTTVTNVTNKYETKQVTPNIPRSPLLTASPPEIGVISGRNKPGINWRIFNKGNEVARRVKLVGDVYFAEYRPASEEELFVRLESQSRVMDGNFEILPGDDNDVLKTKLLPDLTPDEELAFSSAKKVIYFATVSTYEGDSHRHYRTESCFVITPESYPILCKNHNFSGRLLGK